MYKCVSTDTEHQKSHTRLHPTPLNKEQTHAHTPHHTVSLLSSVLRSAVQVPQSDKFLCLVNTDVKNIHNLSFFSPLSKTVQLLFLSVIFFCCCCCCGPETRDNGSFRKGLVNLSVCLKMEKMRFR